MNRKEKIRRSILYSLFGLVSLALLVGVWLSALKTQQSPYIVNDFVMDTFVEMKLYGKDREAAAKAVQSLLKRMDQELSCYRSNSEISLVNRFAGKEAVKVSESTYQLLRKAVAYCEQSDGLFDITLAPLTKLWDVTGAEPQVPAAEEISRRLELVGYRRLAFYGDSGKVKLLKESSALDLGGLAKGYAADVAAALLPNYELTGGYLSIGSNLYVLGSNGAGEGSYRFGIRDPRGEANEYIATLDLRAGFHLATSGDYERYFIKDGIRYHHILDPRTGYPAQSDLISVTVIAREGTLSDYLSTYFFVAGLDTALEHLNEEEYQLILVDQDKNVYCSPSLRTASGGKLAANAAKTDYTFHFD